MVHVEQDGQTTPGGSETCVPLIPKPSNVSGVLSPYGSNKEGLARQMKLGRTTDRLAIYCYLVAKIAALSDEHAAQLSTVFTSAHRLEFPRYTDWKAFVALVKQELPIINIYEDAWPVAAIVREHRRRCRGRNTAERGSGLLKWESKAPAGSDPQRVMFNVSAHPDTLRNLFPNQRRPAATAITHAMQSASSRRSQDSQWAYRPEASIVRLIPKPRNISAYISPPDGKTVKNCLAKQMKLGKTDNRLALYCHLVARIAALSEEPAAPTKVVHAHPNRGGYAEWQAFIDIVKNELPIINAYENAWPVPFIVYRHRNRKRHSKNRIGLLEWEDKAPPMSGTRQSMLDLCQHPEWLSSPSHHASRDATPSSSSDSDRSAVSPLGRPAPVATATRTAARPVSSHRPDRARPQNGPHTQSGRGDELGARRRTRRQFLESVYIRGHRVSDPTNTSASAGLPSLPSAATRNGLERADTPLGDRLEPVREFLRALHPEQSRLLPVLVEKGVASAADLDGLAFMQRVRRKKLLNAWLREETITELQFEALDAGFEAMLC